MGTGRRKLMRIDRARATETIETIARIESKDDERRARTGPAHHGVARSERLGCREPRSSWFGLGGCRPEVARLPDLRADSRSRSFAHAGWVLDLLESSHLRARCRGLVAALDKLAQASLVATPLAIRQALDRKEAFVQPSIAPRGHPGLTRPGRPPGQEQVLSLQVVHLDPPRFGARAMARASLCCWNWHEAGPAIPRPRGDGARVCRRPRSGSGW